MSFAQFSFRESLRDIEYCLSSMQTKLYHCGIKSQVARSTLADANENRDWRIYEGVAKVLMKIVAPMYKGDNALAKELGTVIYAFDSTTISLCLSLFPWAVYSKRRKALKVHVLLNTDGAIPEFVHITNANRQDMLMMDELHYKAGCFYVLDKAYVHYKRLYKIEVCKAFFVTRGKANMSYVVKKKQSVNREEGVVKDQLIVMKRWHTRRWYPAFLRRIEYTDSDTGKRFVFLTNNLLLDAVVIASLYKERWKVELFFKWIKQHLRIKKFFGNSENAVKTQIWIAVCNYLQIAFVKKRYDIPLSLNQIMQVLSVNLFEKDELKNLFCEEEAKTISNQISLFEKLTGQ